MNCDPGGSFSSGGQFNGGLATARNGPFGSSTNFAPNPTIPAVPPRPATGVGVASTNGGLYRPQWPGSSYGSYGSYGSYSPYSMGYSGSYGAMSPYGGAGGFGGVGGSGSSSSDIEASWRQAFSSIESVVRTCSSVTMMLDSTYFAVFNCFRAVVGLGEHFGDVKAQIGRIFNMFPFVRWALRLVRFLLRLVGLSHLMPELSEQSFVDAWANANSSDKSSVPALPGHVAESGATGLPSLVYFCVIFGLPWLVWKLMSLTVQKTAECRQWCRKPHPVALAQFDYSSDRTDELSFLRGAKVHLAPLEQQPHPRSGWLLATIDGKRFGMVPKNYLAPPTMSTGVGAPATTSAESLLVPPPVAPIIRDDGYETGATDESNGSFGDAGMPY